MFKKIICSAFLLSLAGCMPTSTGMLQGGVYNNVKDKAYYTNVDTSVSARKTGEACTQNVLGLVSWGDSSVETAKRNGGVNKVSHIDKTNQNILGFVYAEGCTVVHGD